MKVSQIFWKQIQSLSSVLGLNDQAMASMMCLTEHDFVKYKTKKIPVPINCSINLCDRLGITLEKLLSGKVDFMRLRESFYGMSNSLPVRYDFGKFSKVRTVMNILDYIERYHGQEVKAHLLKCLQVSSEFLANPENNMNIFVMKDICNFLEKKMGYDHSDFVSLGYWSYFTHKDSNLGQKLASHRGYEELFDATCNEYCKEFDDNFNYDLIRTTDNSVTLRISETQMATELIGAKTFIDKPMNTVRNAVIASLPLYLGGKPGEIVTHKSRLQGDRYSEISILFNEDK
jgi:hypothetical protein